MAKRAPPFEQQPPSDLPRTLASEERLAQVGSDTGQESSSGEIRRQIAEAAYYLAEQRGFAPGCDVDDWLAAEAQIRVRRSAASH